MGERPVSLEENMALSEAEDLAEPGAQGQAKEYRHLVCRKLPYAADVE